MAYDSWYCGLPSFFSDRIESCVPTAADQVTIMQGNFGANSNPAMVNQAISDWQDWLAISEYDKNVADKVEGAKSSSMVNLVGLGLIAFVALTMVVGAHGPSRYGR